LSLGKLPLESCHWKVAIGKLPLENTVGKIPTPLPLSLFKNFPTPKYLFSIFRV